MTNTANEAWQEAVRDIDIAKIKELLDDDPALANQGIIHTRGNGTTYEKSPLRRVNMRRGKRVLTLLAIKDKT